jgi:hypothetical protein
VAEGAGHGTIDARSHASGVGDAPVEPEQSTGGALEGGSHGPLPYARRVRGWGDAPRTAKANRVDIEATDLSTATLDVRRAGVGCDADLRIRSTRPLRLALAGCDQTVTAPRGTSRRGCVSRRAFTIRLQRRLRGRRVVTARVYVRGKRVRVRRLRARVDLRGARRGRYTVRIVSRLSNRRTVTQRRAYRTCTRRR